MASDEAKDATRRTRLANERTYLAWWRTGLSSVAVAVGLGSVVPGVAHVTKWPYQAVGVGFGVLGIAFIVVAHVRVRTVEAAVDRGEFPHGPPHVGRAPRSGHRARDGNDPADPVRDLEG